MTRFQDTRRKQSESLKSVGGVSIFAAGVLVWCCCTAALAEMTIRAEENGGDGPLMREPKQYSRFAKRTASETESSFIGGTQDWSGVGRTTKVGGQLVETQSRWGTLVTPSWYVSADHWPPRPGNELRFFHGNDAAKFESRRVVANFPLYDRQAYTVVAGGKQLRMRDGAIGQLEAPVSARVACYPMLVMNLFGGTEVLMFGVDQQDNRRPDQMKLGGQLINTQTLDASLPTMRSKAFHLNYVPKAGQGTNVSPIVELMAAMPRLYDSGAPTFTRFTTRPILVGTQWAGLPGTAGDDYIKLVHRFEINCLAFYRDQINERMDAVQAAANIPVARRERAVFLTMTDEGTLNELDFTGDFRTDADDITLLTCAARWHKSHGNNWALDVNRDGNLDRDDAQAWLTAVGTAIGDTDLDRDVDADDRQVILDNRVHRMRIGQVATSTATAS